MQESMVKVQVSEVISAADKVLESDVTQPTHRLARTLKHMALRSGDGYVFLCFGDFRVLFQGYQQFSAIKG